MENWKKILLRAAGFGGGFAIVAALIFGGILWWSYRPVKPKPWNTTAITATFDNLTTEGPTHTIRYQYTLENHTDVDYRLADDSHAQLGISKMQTKSIDFDTNNFVTLGFPIYVPAKSRVNVSLHMPLQYTEDVDFSAPDDVQHDFYTKLSKYVGDAINNVEGFVLMDDNNRYEIIFPNGWTAIGNRPLRIKTPDTAK